MRVSHTSDWHIGRALYGRKRYEEFEGFLDWLVETLQREQVDALLVAGDVFDSGTPSNRSQELYYRFLCRAAGSACRHVVVVAGNHDSPSFLDAPREILKSLKVYVAGAAAGSPDEEVLVLEGPDGSPELIVCAVPYLRDRDIRQTEAGESVNDKERKLVEGIARHYAEVVAAAASRRTQLGTQVPIVATGHLFVAGGRTVDGDGVRDLYVGSLAQVGTELFPDQLDYLALGHLHVPQRVAGSETRRYSGSPIPMGFGEAGQEKSVCLVDFDGRKAGVRTLPVPVFQKLERVTGTMEQILSRIREGKAIESSSWLEITYTGDDAVGDLRRQLDQAIAGTRMEILRIRNARVMERVLGQTRVTETLDDLDEKEVFERCLTAHEVPDHQRPELRDTYQETLTSLFEADSVQP
jgi:exonuclease SbcD